MSAPQPRLTQLPSTHEQLGERRRSLRTYTIYRLVRVECRGDEGLARCRNISDGGMKLEIAMPVQLGDAVQVTFSPSVVLPCRVAWIEGSECGVLFDQDIDCAQLLARTAAEVREHGSWDLRLKTNLPAKVFVDGHVEQAVVTDISPRGVRLTHECSFSAGLHVKLVLYCGKERDAVVRWSRDWVSVMLLIEPFSVDDLGSIRAL